MNQTIIWLGVNFSKFLLGQFFNIILSYDESIKLIYYTNSLKFIQGGCTVRATIEQKTSSLLLSHFNAKLPILASWNTLNQELLSISYVLSVICRSFWLELLNIRKIISRYMFFVIVKSIHSIKCPRIWPCSMINKNFC